MSSIPQSTRDAAAVIRAGAESEGRKAFISIRAARGPHGFHAGKAEIFGPGGDGLRDYSVRAKRNRAGLSNASSAMDVTIRGPQNLKRQREFTAFMVAEAKAGRADLFEIIGPNAEGKAAYWSKKNGWNEVLGWQTKKGWVPVDPSHTWHTHFSFWRDTEFSDRAAMFRPLWPQVQGVPAEHAVDDPEPLLGEPPEEDKPEDDSDTVELILQDLAAIVVKYST